MATLTIAPTSAAMLAHRQHLVGGRRVWSSDSARPLTSNGGQGAGRERLLDSQT